MRIKKRGNSKLGKFTPWLKQFYESVWFFPAVLFIPVILLSVFKISGSSIGVYHNFLYGNKDDSNVILQEPRTIRSDEWLVNTQLTLAQAENGFERYNQNIGNGQDMSIIVDAPYKDWSSIFKPRSLVFFALPLEIAFAMRWWLMGYLLVVSCYFLIDTIMPKRRLFAALIALSFLFSPFIQWWYVSGTLGVLYHAMFALTFFLKLIDSKKLKQKILWGSLMSYSLVCFAVLLYPPFQVVVALVAGSVGIGFLIERLKNKPRKEILATLASVAIPVVVAGLLTLLYLATRQEAINALLHTAYPGNRIQLSGGYDIVHLLSGTFDIQLQNSIRAVHYTFTSVGALNQSEASNFILLLPFLLAPGILLLIRDFHKKRVIDWPLLGATLISGLFVLRLFVPRFNFLFKLLMVDKVPHNRLLIGIGLLNIIYLVLLVRSLAAQKKQILPRPGLIAYSVGVFALQLWVGLTIKNMFPGYIGIYKVALLSLGITVVVYLMLTKKFVLSAALLLCLSVASAGRVNPLQRGLSEIRDTEISHAISSISDNDSGRWASEGLIFENLTLANGAPSLNGVYIYPQLDLWEGLSDDSAVYNRYAHVFFNFDRDPNNTVKSEVNLLGGDNFNVSTEPCSDYIKKEAIKYILALAPLDGQDSCATQLSKVTYPGFNFYIYKLNY